MDTWKRCGSCKKDLPYGVDYYKCSVSTCNRARFQLVFCSMKCWDAHLPVMNHREAWATEHKAPRAPPALPRVGGGPSPAPRSAATAGDTNSPRGPTRRIARGGPSQPTETDVLVVASRLKDYIQRKGGMRTSGDVLDALSHIIRREADKAIEQAREDGRQTVKGRDFGTYRG